MPWQQSDSRHAQANALLQEAEKSYEWVSELSRYRRYLREVKGQGNVHVHFGRPTNRTEFLTRVIASIQPRKATTKTAFLKWLKASILPSK
jgi:hypothetical protein